MTRKATITVLGTPAAIEKRWSEGEYRPEYIEGADAAVCFKDAPGDRGTEIHVDLEREAPGGKLGEVVHKLTGDRAAGQGQGRAAPLQAARRDGRDRPLGRRRPRARRPSASSSSAPRSRSSDSELEKAGV